MRPRVAELLLAPAAVIAFFGLAEGGLRLGGYGSQPELPGPMYVRSVTRGYDLRPGYTSRSERSPYLVHPPIRINAMGFRGSELSAPRGPRPRRLLCLGDSYIFGWGVSERETTPALLQEALAARPGGEGVEVINAGVPAYGTAQEASLLAEEGWALGPRAVVLGYVLNDALPGGDLRRHWRIPLKSILRHSAVYRFRGRLYQQGLTAALAEAAPEETLADVLAYERACTELLEGGSRAAEQARRESVRQIAKIARGCRSRGVAFLVVIYPNRHQIEDPGYQDPRFNRLLASELEARGIRTLDLFAEFKSLAGSARGAERLFLADTHPSARGHRIAAEAIARWIEERDGAREAGL